MNVKQLSLLAGGATMLLAATASADFQGLSADIVGTDLAVPGAPAHWTARIYANLDAGSRLDAIYGNADNPLSMGTTSSLFQSDFGGATTQAINPALYNAFPSLVYDSWVTIGLEDQGGNALSEIGLIHDDASGTSTSDGSFYVTPDDAQGAEIDGRVLIAQFTTYGDDAVLSGTVSLQGKDANGDNWTAESQSYSFGNVVPAPGALALLGLAGFAGRRRRRA